MSRLFTSSARSDETAQEVRPEGQEPDPAGDAPKLPSSNPETNPNA